MAVVDAGAAVGLSAADAEIEEMQKKVQEMEAAEDEKLKKLIDSVEESGKGDAATAVERSAADAEIEAMRKKVQEMEAAEDEKLRKLNDSVDESEDVDKRSVYVGNVDYGSTPEELLEHLKSCGQIKRITILVDKYTGIQKGFAYIEFADDQSVQNSLLLNGSIFRGRQIKVIQKRTNVPHYGKGGPNGKGKGKGKPKGKGKGLGPMWADPYYGYASPWKGGYKGGYKGYSLY